MNTGDKGHLVLNRQVPGRKGSKPFPDTSSLADGSAKPQLRLAASDGKLLLLSTLEASSFPNPDLSLVVVRGEKG